MPETITSKDNKRIKELVKLQDHPSPDRFLIEGEHAVEVAYSRGLLDELYTLEDPSLQGVMTFLITESICKKVSKAASFEKCFGVAHLNRCSSFGSRVLIFDRIQDPGNIGTLLRSASSFGFEDIIFLPGTCSPFNSKAIASAEGALFHLNLHFMAEDEAVETLRKLGYVLYGSALRNAVALEKAELKKTGIALILGNEGRGMSESLLGKTDLNLKISMEKMESLNVGVAGGILMHHLAYLS